MFTSLKIQSYNYGAINVDFLEDNGFFDMSNEGLERNKEKLLSINVGLGDSIEIFDDSEFFESKMIPKINHYSDDDGDGFTTIKNGRHTFKFSEGKFNGNFGNLNTKNKESIPLQITSDSLLGEVISMNDNNGYIQKNIKSGKIMTHNTFSNDEVDYEFESIEGEKMYNHAKDAVVNSYFKGGGRGDVCYTSKDEGYITEKSPTGEKMYDCSGLPITGLLKIYPESSLSDFPPNLKLVESLEKRGWSNYIVEPSSIVGEKKAIKDIKNIPAGSIVLLMHSYKGTSDATKTKKGIDYIEYFNELGEEINLLLGHTLIRGKGESNFLNAIPEYYPDLLPPKIRELDKQLILEGKDTFAEGVVKEGEIEYLKDDYFIVITPPPKG